jgi:phage-related protein (TIGR01555 family)
VNENAKEAFDLIKVMTMKESENLETRVQSDSEHIINTVKDSVVVNDAYGNSLAAIGTDDKVTSFTNYGFSNDTLNWCLWTALYNDSWVFRRAIDKPAQDEIRAGITVQGDFDKDSVYRILKKYRFDFIKLLQWGALYGGSIAVMLFDGMQDADYLNGLDINLGKIRKAKAMRMYVVDRWYGVAPTFDDTVTEMDNLDFGKPKFYNVTFADGKTMKIHHDYILRYEHRTAPQLVKNGMLQGWGYAEGAHILNELTRDDKFKATINSLVDKSLIEVIKMSGMRGVFMGSDSANNEQLTKRLEMVNWGRTYNSLTFLDKDDEYQQNQFSGLTGLADLLEKNMWLVAAALDMQGILFGDLKGGFSNDTEALERYDETIQGRCESYVRPVFEKFLWVIYKKLGIEEGIEFTFNSLVADAMNDKRMQSLKNFVELCDTLLGAGVFDAKLYAKSVQTYIEKGTIDFGLTDDVIEKLDNSDEMENINIDEMR